MGAVGKRRKLPRHQDKKFSYFYIGKMIFFLVFFFTQSSFSFLLLFGYLIYQLNPQGPILHLSTPPPTKNCESYEEKKSTCQWIFKIKNLFLLKRKSVVVAFFFNPFFSFFLSDNNLSVVEERKMLSKILWKKCFYSYNFLKKLCHFQSLYKIVLTRISVSCHVNVGKLPIFKQIF